VDGSGEGETPIRIMCRNYAKSVASNHVIAYFNVRGLLISKSSFHHSNVVAEKGRKI
jgi:hypothetical protein